jgi:CheY-like chemotaxis protein
VELVELVRWLRGMEESANRLYRDAGKRFANQPELAALLSQLARDEASHAQLLDRAAERLLAGKPAPQAAVTVDRATRERMERPMHEGAERVARGDLSERDLLELIVQLEHAELNDIFLYVVQSAEPVPAAFQRVAASMQAHVDGVDRFLESLPPERRPSTTMPMPTVWTTRILVVDDNAAVAELWRRMLSRRGRVEVAGDGQEALERLRGQYFDAVISDVDMPVLDGIGFFEAALRQDASLAQHFIFCTGNVERRVTELSARHRLPVLHKPVSVAEMLRTVERVVTGGDGSV